jgi:4-hydroxy-3-methylbut-2-enyl diphosphate reductase
MKVEIDQKSGFCFGVVNAIGHAEKELQHEKKLYCLGDIVHNEMEIKRLEAMGMETISREKYFSLKNCRVLLRAHGEPPSTYEYAKANNIELIDATCPVVLKLQQRVKEADRDMRQKDGQIIIFGKKGHAETVALNGQTNDQSIIIENEGDLQKIDPTKPAYLFSQTTKSVDEFHQLAEKITQRSSAKVTVKDTVCRQVANRAPRIQEFAAKHDVVVFVGGKKSSNAKYLFGVCQQSNPDSYFISTPEEIDFKWFTGKGSAGVCGATSTPQWLMEKVASLINQL